MSYPAVTKQPTCLSCNTNPANRHRASGRATSCTPCWSKLYARSKNPQTQPVNCSQQSCSNPATHVLDLTTSQPTYCETCTARLLPDIQPRQPRECIVPLCTNIAKRLPENEIPTVCDSCYTTDNCDAKKFELYCVFCPPKKQKELTLTMRGPICGECYKNEEKRKRLAGPYSIPPSKAIRAQIREQRREHKGKIRNEKQRAATALPPPSSPLNAGTPHALNSDCSRKRPAESSLAPPPKRAATALETVADDNKFLLTQGAGALFAVRNRFIHSLIFTPDISYMTNPQWLMAQPQIYATIVYLFMGDVLNPIAHRHILNRYINGFSPSLDDAQPFLTAKQPIPPFTPLGLCVGDYVTRTELRAAINNPDYPDLEKYAFYCPSINLAISTYNNLTMHPLLNTIETLTATTPALTRNVTTIFFYYYGWPYFMYVSYGKAIQAGERLLLDESQAIWKHM